MAKHLDYQAFSITVPEAWEDITSSLNVQNYPITLEDPTNPIGTLQLSVATYKSGQIPDFSVSSLENLLDSLAARRGLDEALSRTSSDEPQIMVRKSYQLFGDYVEFACISDGRSMLLATYMCDWQAREQEAAEREVAYHSIQFASGNPPSAS